MPRFARIVVMVTLVAALSSRVLAAPANTANLDAARMFDPAAESLLAQLFVPAKDLSPLSLALFNAPSPAAAPIFVAPPDTVGGSATIAAVALHPYAASIQIPDAPLTQPSVTPIAPVPHLQDAQRAQVSQPEVRLAISEPSVRFGTYSPYVPALQSVHENVQVPVRIGPVHFAGTLSGEQAQTIHADSVRAMQLCGTTDEAAACPYLHDERAQNLAAGTNFNVRAGNTQVNLQLSGSVGHVSNGDAALYQYTPLDADTQLDTANAGSPEDTSLLYYPGLTEVVRHGLNARVAVPVSRALTVGLQYDTSHYQGDYGALLAPGLDARKDTYLGNVTYQLPHSTSLITLSARQFRYQDTFAPNFNLTETRADLSFTVKF